jgi:spore germination cell wall hydrolase CwlJ-like protein
MRSKLRQASALAVAATITTLAIATGDTGASAETRDPVAVAAQTPETTFISQPVLQPLPEKVEEEAQPEAEAVEISASSLMQLVAAQPNMKNLSREMNCLAGAIYFESRGESLAGQLAVGRVIVERAASSRFPNSYCGVVFQRSQFSFVRGGSMPAIRKGSAAWTRAKAIARIADTGSWESKAEGALFFHATHVSPGWRLARIARIDNHVFYR